MARETVQQMMAGVQHDGCRLVARNTVRYRKGATVIYRLHRTDIIVESGDTVTLYCGGYRTVTTKDRINRFSPVRIHSDKGIWYIGDVPFYDGIQVRKDGTVIADLDMAEREKAWTLAMRRSIDKLVRLCDGGVPESDAGDCWFCQMGQDSADHMKSHVTEGYLHGSLVRLMGKWRGRACYQWPMASVVRTLGVQTIKRDLRNFLRAKLGV